MKNVLFFGVLISTVLLMTSCDAPVNVDHVLKDETTRQQVFEKIAGDHNLMTEMMDAMTKNDHGKIMMREGMMNMMAGEENIMGMMKDKPDMMNNMMHNMMRDSNMMRQMMQRMTKEGMMSEECMNACKNMMGGKNMGKDGNQMHHK